ETPSLVMVGAPHFLSSTTLRPLGPRVTRTASASWFIPDSSLRRASSSYAICFAIAVCPPLRSPVAANPGRLALSYLECQSNHRDRLDATPERRFSTANPSVRTDRPHSGSNDVH